ncbi:MAG TPA: hypothetical protein VFS40_11040 [Gemmatimonadales bacterium]|nr:hypothetical protein [Gemmatimonadales bacterium]
MSPRLTLVIAVVALVLWIVLAGALPPTVASVHLLLAVSATLLVRWWALTK